MSMCKVCEKMVEKYCIKCDIYFCTECLTEFHDLKKKSDHLESSISNKILKMSDFEALNEIERLFGEFFE